MTTVEIHSADMGGCLGAWAEVVHEKRAVYSTKQANREAALKKASDWCDEQPWIDQFVFADSDLKAKL